MYDETAGLFFLTTEMGEITRIENVLVGSHLSMERRLCLLRVHDAVYYFQQCIRESRFTFCHWINHPLYIGIAVSFDLGSIFLNPTLRWVYANATTTHAVRILLVVGSSCVIVMKTLAQAKRYLDEAEWLIDLVTISCLVLPLLTDLVDSDSLDLLTVIKSLQVCNLILSKRPSFSNVSPSLLQTAFRSSLVWRFGLLITMTILGTKLAFSYLSSVEGFRFFLVLVLLTLSVGGFLLLAQSATTTMLNPLHNFLLEMSDLSEQISASVRNLSNGSAPARRSTVSMDGTIIDRMSTEVPFDFELLRLKRIVNRLKAFISIHSPPAFHSDLDRAIIYSVGAVVKVETESCRGLPPLLLSELGEPGIDYSSLWLLLRSWEFNPLHLSYDEQNYVIDSIFFRHEELHIDRATFSDFLRITRSKYHSENPYHRFEHALDVCHTVHRYLQLSDAASFLRPIDRAALLFASLIHDIGHPGVNNQYLVDTSHELAIRFNDKSPLENYHCSLFFEIVHETNLFAKFSVRDQKELRRVVVDAVLHTDNALHFQMLKEITVFNEMHGESLELDRIDVLTRFESRNLINKLFLHAADISNPTKPFSICREWAMLVMEEFFSQGDLERSAGVVVSPLNDRTKVNIPVSQISFIEFVVAPLTLQQFRLFPIFADSCRYLVRNATQWALECSPNEDRGKLIERCKKIADSFRAVPVVGDVYVLDSLFSFPSGS